MTPDMKNAKRTMFAVLNIRKTIWNCRALHTLVGHFVARVPLIKIKLYHGRHQPLKRAFNKYIAIPALILVRQSL